MITIRIEGQEPELIHDGHMPEQIRTAHEFLDYILADERVHMDYLIDPNSCPHPKAVLDIAKIEINKAISENPKGWTKFFTFMDVIDHDGVRQLFTVTSWNLIMTGADSSRHSLSIPVELIPETMNEDDFLAWAIAKCFNVRTLDLRPVKSLLVQRKEAAFKAEFAALMKMHGHT